MPIKSYLFIDVILPLALPKLYTYSVPLEFADKIKIGQRVVVQFGKQKIYTALVKNIHPQAPNYQTKDIVSLLDDFPIVNNIQFALWEWMASYYMCSQGEVMNVALPSGLKLQSETRIVLNASRSQSENETFSDKEHLITEALQQQNILSLKEIEKIVGIKTVFPIIKSLVEKKIVMVEEELVKKYKPLFIEYVRLTEKAKDEAWMKNSFDKLETKAPKQLELLMAFLKLHYENKNREIRKSELLQSVNQQSTINNQQFLLPLVKKEILEIYEKETGRLFQEQIEQTEKTTLNTLQQESLDEIKKQLKEKDVVLLHGVTSSGKTELYIQLMEESIQQGKQVLYLLPEIALTTQIINRLRKNFGNQVGIYHSRLNDNERVETWKKVAHPQPLPIGGELPIPLGKSDGNSLPLGEGWGGANIILGARSALFLPFSNLGLIIVDEEHDTSYKQHDPAPRYNARDTAIYLAHLHKAKTLLGSATPCLESFYNASKGKYGLVKMNERFGGVLMPEIVIVDVKEETRKKIMKSHFSTVLLENIKLALENKEQVILFQNRRGFAPVLQCAVCAWTPHCIHCDVSLTYHKQSEQLRCHYCGYVQHVPSKCDACGDTHIKMFGFGTEKIEEELAIFFPKASIARMDLDTTRSKNAYQRIIQDFEEQRIDILVGTQMVTKGLDFVHVSTVGILNADSMLNFPDFRAFEKSFQLMAQVSGRAGRKQKRGKVLIQTFNLNHPVIQHVLHHHYDEMYAEELAERKKFNYPPFYRLLQITLKHKDIRLLSEVAEDFAKTLKATLGKRVLGPELPLIARVKNLYLKNILIKIERELSVDEAKKRILAAINTSVKLKANQTVQVQLDVDPM